MAGRHLHLMRCRAAVEGEGDERVAGGVGGYMRGNASQLDAALDDLPDRLLRERLLALFSYII